MSGWFPARSIFVLASLGLLKSCGKPTLVVDQENAETDSAIQLPLTRTLRNLEGTMIKAQIISHDHSRSGREAI